MRIFLNIDLSHNIFIIYQKQNNGKTVHGKKLINKISTHSRNE